ncbi:MAG: DNA gyrase inhibitor YacG [Bacteriovorax sp.]|jgi:endogenous inhibitor of DNA gyrase (YacG/DUF329 family)|nr:DNA gyrase inhibitor YacG [Bacteriovorax sp.]
MNKNLRVKCPQCQLEFSYYESKFRPFCTERCKLIDLGHWFQESYKVPEKEKNQQEIKDGQNAKENEAEIEQDKLSEDEYSEDDYK